MIDDSGEDEEGNRWLRIATIAVAVLVVVAMGFGVFTLVTQSAGKRRVVDTIALKLVAPPPPPPPPKVEPPPEPPKMLEQKIEPPVDKPIDQPKDQPPQGPLSLDAKGEAGGDSFGLGGKLGGSDFFGGGGTRFGHYAVLMQDQISKAMQRDDQLNGKKFRATVKVWISPSGKIERVEIIHTSGDRDIDGRIEQVIAEMATLPEAPPDDMPEPVIVRVGARPGIG